MEAHFKITEKDYISAIQLSTQQERLIVHLIIIALFSLAHFFIVDVFYATPLLAAILFLIVGGILCHYVFFPFFWKRQYRKYKMIQEEITLRLENETITITSQDGQAQIDLSKMLKWKENSDYVLLYLMPRLFYIIPKRIEASGFDIHVLTDLLKKQLGKAK